MHPLAAFVQAKLATDVQPIFPNNAQGWAALLGSVILILSVIEGVRYGLHVRPVEKDLTALGAKVDRIDKDQERVKEQVQGLKDLIAAGNKDTLTAILAMGKQQTEATHKVELRVAELGTVANIGDAIIEAGDRVADRIERVLTRRDER